MKYKVGDKVRIREDLVMGENYGDSVAVDDMVDMAGSVVTIERFGEVHGYYIKEDPDDYCWTDEMFEPVEEELTAEEAIRILGGMCRDFSCCECPIYELIEDEGNCDNLRAEKPDKVIEVLKQWKKDHEKKPIETENVMYIVVMDEKRNVVYEEKTNEAIITATMKEEVLKKYCTEHDGKYYAIGERRCVVKE